MRLKVLLGAVAIAALGSMTTYAQSNFSRTTYLTFSGPVELPRVTLPAGTYVFQLANPTSGDRTVIRVGTRDGKTHYGYFLTMPNKRMTPPNQPMVMFRESPAGSPKAVRAWFYPGVSTGYEFVYPRSQAMKIAQAAHEPVLSMPDQSSDIKEEGQVAALRDANVQRIDEAGRAADDRGETLIVQNNPPQPPSTVGTAGRTLPKTASSLPLVGLFSVLAFAGALGFSLLRMRMSS